MIFDPIHFTTPPHGQRGLSRLSTNGNHVAQDEFGFLNSTQHIISGVPVTMKKISEIYNMNNVNGNFAKNILFYARTMVCNDRKRD